MFDNLNPATIEALTKFVQTLDQHPFGAVMFVICAVSVFVAAPALGAMYRRRQLAKPTRKRARQNVAHEHLGD